MIKGMDLIQMMQAQPRELDDRREELTKSPSYTHYMYLGKSKNRLTNLKTNLLLKVRSPTFSPKRFIAAIQPAPVDIKEDEYTIDELIYEVQVNQEKKGPAQIKNNFSLWSTRQTNRGSN